MCCVCGASSNNNNSTTPHSSMRAGTQQRSDAARGERGSERWALGHSTQQQLARGSAGCGARRGREFGHAECKATTAAGTRVLCCGCEARRGRGCAREAGWAHSCLGLQARLAEEGCEGAARREKKRRERECLKFCEGLMRGCIYSFSLPHGLGFGSLSWAYFRAELNLILASFVGFDHGKLTGL